MRILIFAFVFWMPLVAQGATDTAERARAAAEMLDVASANLEEASSARDRVRALTATISAFEAGLGALRSGLRQASLREKELTTKLQASDEEVAALLAVLLRVGGTESPVVLLHPGGPMGTARAGMMVAEVAPALNAQAVGLRNDLEELQQLRQVLATSAERLETGLQEVQRARAALSQAIADRTSLPKRFIADPVREAILLSSADTLDSFAQGLDQISAGVAPAAPDAMTAVKGALDLPVSGQVLRYAGEADAAGIARPGIILSTAPNALVTSPVGATLRYVGPLLDFGQVVILEPQAGVLFVFAGLKTIYAETADVIEAGAPLGLMGDVNQKSVDALSTDGDETGAMRAETLYIEVRENNATVDPALWFRTDKNG